MQHPAETRLPALEPYDQHNRELERHVHPPDWVNPRPTGRYNLVVVGGGTAGLVTAAGAAGLGARVALVERDLLGGDCLNIGCVPSKALLRSARAIADVRSASKYGIRLPQPAEVDFPAVMQRLRGLRAQISPHDSAARFRDLGVDVYFGAAKFIDEQHLEVEGQRLHFSRACIATGARAANPGIPGIAQANYLTNETLFSLTELPRRLGIIGGGPIGCEMAQAFARFGSEVHLFEVSDGILSNDDRAAVLFVEQALQNDGVQLHYRSQNLRVERTADTFAIAAESDGKSQQVPVDHLLIAAGRTPNVEHLNLEAAQVKYDRQGVTVDDFLRTSNPRIYSAGDVCSRFKFTHAADAMARIVIQNSLFLGRKRASSLNIPWCTYTDPEISHVGLTEKLAAQRNIPLDTFEIALNQVDRAILDGDTVGLLRVHVARKTDKLLGATLVARHAGDLIAELSLAIENGLGLAAIARTIHSYPTQAEIIKKAADAHSRTRLTPRVKKLFQWWLSWRR